MKNFYWYDNYTGFSWGRLHVWWGAPWGWIPDWHWGSESCCAFWVFWGCLDIMVSHSEAWYEEND